MMATPKLIPGVAYTLPEFGLGSQSGGHAFQANPTLAAADVTWAADGVNIGNVTNLPTAMSGNTKLLTFTFTAAETAQIAKRYSLKFSDVAGAEWNDLILSEFVGYPDAIQSGVATAGGASTITIATAVTANILAGCRVDIVGGTGVGQSRVVISNTTTVVTVSRAWTTNPDNTSQYVIQFADAFLTDGAIVFPAEAAGRPTTFLAAMRRVFEKMSNKRNRDRATGIVALRNAADSATLETQTQSTVGTVDTISQGA